MALIEIKRTVNLDEMLRVDSLNGVAFTNENAAHKFTITCMRNGAPYSLANTTISARFMRADGTTVNVTGGTVDGNVATLILAKRDCYNVPGRFRLSILCTAGTSVLCIYSAVGTVTRSTDETVIDTGTVLPDAATVAQMFEQLGDQLDESYQYGTRIGALETGLDSLEDVVDTKASASALSDEVARAQGAEMGLSQQIGTVGSSVASLSTFATDRFKTIAPDFSTSTAYAVGDSVYHENKLYRFTTAHPAGAWDSSHVTEATVGASIKRVRDEIAGVFSESKSYVPGDYCYHGDYLVRCRVAHQGAWDDSHFSSITVGDMLEQISAITAPYFSESTAYSVGDYCIREDLTAHELRMYRFTTSHTGAWNISHVARVTVADELEALNDRPAYTFTDDGEGNITIS